MRGSIHRMTPLAIIAAAMLGLSACGDSGQEAASEPPTDVDGNTGGNGGNDGGNDGGGNDGGNDGGNGSPDPVASVPASGRLTQRIAKGPISHVTASGWRTEIRDGTVTVRPPVGVNYESDGFQYVSQGTRESFGPRDLRSWQGDRRSLLLPGGAKLTLHAAGSQLTKVSLYDGNESHQIDVVAQAVTHSRVDADLAASRDAGEHDGETAYFSRLQFRAGTIDWIYLSNIYVQGAAADGTPQDKKISAVPLARQFSPTHVDVYPVSTPAAAAEVTDACDAVVKPRGGLTQDPAGPLTYVTRSGESTIKIDRHTITVTRTVSWAGGQSGFTWQVWGDPHENLNGKHIKDWLGLRRTLLLSDGTKITMHADGPDRVVHTTSIYDGPQSHQIGNTTNLLRHSCVNTAVAQQREAQEYDGETVHLTLLPQPGSVVGGLFAINIYDEQPVAGGGTSWQFVPTPLGETGAGDLNPNQVNDLYDDPRLGHT
ncbi:MAG: hypothetical protein J0H09_25660 [Burkholderiales bacterium]|nr:hypothetical protein [Burkholderiales bacterium]